MRHLNLDFAVEQYDFLFKIKRFEYFKDTTIGKLFEPGKAEEICWTLEDAVRPSGIKIKKHTAIPPTGISFAYKLGMRFSPRFNRKMPVIYTHKQGEAYVLENGGIKFVYAQIHGGNKHDNTEGCPLVAYNRSAATTIQGTAEKEITKLVKHYMDRGKVGIQIFNGIQENKRL